MQILAIISGEYGKRHAANIRDNGPKEWHVHEGWAPSVLPPIVD